MLYISTAPHPITFILEWWNETISLYSPKFYHVHLHGFCHKPYVVYARFELQELFILCNTNILSFKPCMTRKATFAHETKSLKNLDFRRFAVAQNLFSTFEGKFPRRKPKKVCSHGLSKSSLSWFTCLLKYIKCWIQPDKQVCVIIHWRVNKKIILHFIQNPYSVLSGSQCIYRFRYCCDETYIRATIRQLRNVCKELFGINLLAPVPPYWNQVHITGCWSSDRIDISD